MSIVYVNNFDHLLQGWSPPHDVTASMAAFDPPIFVPQRPIAFFGPMHPGSSEPAPAAVIKISPGTIGQPPHQLKVTEGTTVTLSNAAAAANQSRTFYVCALNEILLSRGSVFEAELVFDKPMATLAGGTGKFWAAGLNFKTGDATDAAADARAGVTCQFNDNGFIKFHGTDNVTFAGPLNATYAEYAGNPLTEFRLTVTVFVKNGAIAGTGTLKYDDNFAGGNLKAIGNAPFPDPTKITAVGLALATTSGGFTEFGARLRSFTLSVT